MKTLSDFLLKKHIDSDLQHSHEYELRIYHPSEAEKIMLEVRENIPLIKISLTPIIVSPIF